MDSRQIVGSTVAHYKILEALASGGMASVYKAVDIQLDRTVVLKVLDGDLLGDEGARRRFLREARLASSLDHPNICTIYEIHEVGNVYYIAMQYVEGLTLKKTINGLPLDTPSLFSISLQVADAVATAHDRGIIHRDIKPHNIMITPRGQAKVLDFGLGKNLEESTSHTGMEITELGSPFGTPSYMSPEQARGERTDRRADVFSFGIVLYEMATGRKPYQGKNAVEIYYAICNKQPAPITQYNRNAPEGLQELIDKAMSKQPSDRYQSMHELLSDLKRISAGIEFGHTVPDGINQPFATVANVRVPWTERFVPRLIKNLLHPRGNDNGTRPGTQEQHRGSNFVPAPIDDFSIIPGLHKTLAVLPFRCLGSETGDDWTFSLLDALIAELAKFKSLTIRPISSVSKYVDRSINPIEAGRELGADAVLAGSFIRADSKLRVTSQLTETESGCILWAGKIDVSEADEMKLIDSICNRLIEGISGKHITADVFDLLYDDSEEIRLDGVSMLMYSHDSRAIEGLKQALFDSSPKVKSAAAEALARFGRLAAPVVSEIIDESSGKEDYQTARFAVKAAGLIGSSEALSPLLEALSSRDSMLASEAALALGQLGDDRALPDLIESLDREDANVRFTSSQALGEIAEINAVPHLEKRLREDEDEGVRAKAQWAISHIRRTVLEGRSKSTNSLSSHSLHPIESSRL